MAESKSYRRDRIGARAAAQESGKPRYQTGIPCKNGHISERFTSSGTCVACALIGKTERDRRYRQKHRAKIDAKNRAWRAANPEKVAAIEARKKANPRTREVNRLASERIRLRNPGRVLQWKRANPEAVKAASNKRRARKLNAGGTHSKDQILEIFRAQKARCAGCKASIRKRYHADHIMPLALGGSNYIKNIQLLCPTCNVKKRAKHPIEWARSLGLLI